MSEESEVERNLRMLQAYEEAESLGLRFAEAYRSARNQLEVERLLAESGTTETAP